MYYVPGTFNPYLFAVVSLVCGTVLYAAYRFIRWAITA